MGRAITTRQANLGTSGEAAAKLMYGGPCELLGLAVNYHTSADSGTVLTIKDGSSAGLTKYTITTGTDFGTTVPVRLFHDARLIAGTATAGVGHGISIFNGVYVDIASDVTGPQSVKIWVRPLIKRTASITTAGAAGSASGEAVLFQGPGRFKGAAVDYQGGPSTTDVQFRDGVSSSGAALTVVSNVNTDWAAVNQQVVTLTGHDEAGSAVTTAATGAYANDGVLFGTGLYVGIAQGDPNTKVKIDALIEA